MSLAQVTRRRLLALAAGIGLVLPLALAQGALARPVCQLVSPARVVLLKTSVALSPGDSFIAQSGEMYRCTSVSSTGSGSGPGSVTVRCARVWAFPQCTYAPLTQREALATRSRGGLAMTALRRYVGFWPDAQGSATLTVSKLASEGRAAIATMGLGPSGAVVTAAPPTAAITVDCDDAEVPPVGLGLGRSLLTSPVLLVVGPIASSLPHASPEGLGMALAIKGLADQLYPGLVRGVVVRALAKGQPSSSSVAALGLVVGDRLHHPPWARRALGHIVELLPGAIFGIEGHAQGLQNITDPPRDTNPQAGGERRDGLV